MTTVLEDLEVEEVSFVDNPANPEATLAIFKSKEDDVIVDLKMKLTDAMRKKLMAAIKDAATPLELEDAFFRTLGEMRKAADAPHNQGGADMPDDLKELQEKYEKLEEELGKAKADLEASGQANVDMTKKLEEATAKLAEVEKKDTPPEDDLPEAVQKRIKAAEDKTAAAVAIAEELRDQNDERDFTDKINSDFGKLSIDAMAFAPVLRRIRKTASEEDFAELERVLASASELVGKGDVFKNKGKDGANSTDDPAAKAMKAAQALIAADPKLSLGDAMSKVFSDNAELHEQYVKTATVKQ